MKKSENIFVYDLLIVGNGIAAKHFLFELSNKISQSLDKQTNYNVAQIYNDNVTPACSEHASVTVSLNGIREDVSVLGDDLRDGYFAFLDLINKYNPEGVTKTKRVVTSTNEEHLKKLYRRYTELQNIELEKINKSFLKGPLDGTSYDAFMINVKSYLDWFDANTKFNSHKKIMGFVNDIIFDGDKYEIHLKNNSVLYSKKLLLCMGAYSKIYSNFIDVFNKLEESNSYNENHNQIKVGSYLHKEVSWNIDPIYLVINGNKLMYYKENGKEYLRLATVTTLGTEVACNHEEFKKIHSLYKEQTNLDIGDYDSFSYDYGLRHKGPRRTVIARELDAEKMPGLFMINGLYKNGFTLSFVGTRKIIDKIMGQ